MKKARSRTARGRKKPGVMNGEEAAYAKHLEEQRLRGEVLWWAYEKITLKLAPKTTYTPDFVWMRPDLTLVVDEYKGWMRDDAWAKLKIAADLYPLVFRLITKRPKRDGGGWQIKEVGE